MVCVQVEISNIAPAVATQNIYPLFLLIVPYYVESFIFVPTF